MSEADCGSPGLPTGLQPMSALSLAPRALYEEVAELMRQRIFARELEPGSWIDELRIAEALGISRTPLREALKVLAAEGLVTMKVRRGAYVTEVSEKDLRDVYHLLALLESDAARVVAQNANPEQMAQIEALHKDLEQAVGNRDRFFEINEAFHMLLLELADNRWRDQMVADLRKVMKLNRHSSLFKEGRIEQSLAEHRDIVQALTQRQPELAAERMPLNKRSKVSGALLGGATRQSAQKCQNEAAIFILQDAHVAQSHGRHVSPNDLQCSNAFIDFGHHCPRQTLQGCRIKRAVIALAEQQRDLGQGEAQILQMPNGLEPIQRIAAILTITGFGSTLRRNQARILIQAQLAAGHASRFAQNAGGLQSLEIMGTGQFLHGVMSGERL
eukprot:gene22138-27097_t